MDLSLPIGKLARAAGVNVETVRYCERRGLLVRPRRPLAGQRRYPARTVERLRFIKRAQALGCTLSEVGVLLSLDRAHACATALVLAQQHCALLERKIADLTALRAEPCSLIRHCEAGAASVRCPIIESLAHD